MTAILNTDKIESIQILPEFVISPNPQVNNACIMLAWQTAKHNSEAATILNKKGAGKAKASDNHC